MNRRTLSFFLRTPALALLALSGTAAAQIEPRPNVLLLVDSSGSMEYRTGFTSTGAEIYPECDPTSPRAEVAPCPADRAITGQLCYNNEKSRWIELVEVLTGDVPNYRCEALSRKPADAKFEALYQLGGDPPYDVGYSSPFHRLLTVNPNTSAICGPGPLNPNPANPVALSSTLPLSQVAWKEWTNQGGDNCGGLDDNDTALGFGRGMLDVFGNEVRFGLMTFDTHTKLGVGAAAFDEGMRGTWDYVGTGDTAHAGRPIGCMTDTVMEVGARNQFAPGWEGRLVGFGNPALPEADPNRNRSIQRVLLSTRPYGATPVAGMLHDAYEFLFEDAQVDPVDPTHTLGPRFDFPGVDPYADGECRQNAIILLTDGEPNQELRPSCVDPGTGSDIQCPFRRPEEIASALATGNGQVKVPVYVVGFSLSEVTIGGATKACSALDLSPTGDCSDATVNAQPVLNQRPLRTCCLLNQIALAGDTDQAYFAANRAELQQVMTDLLNELAAKASARTRPVVASATEFSTGNVSFRFFSGFSPRASELRMGVLERKRIVCRSGAGADPTEEDVVVAKGDDFIANVNNNLGADRRFFTFEGQNLAGVVQSKISLRPFLDTPNDGIPKSLGAVEKSVSGTLSAYVNDLGLAPAALGITGVCPIDSTLDAANCAQTTLRWLVGASNGNYRSRCEGGVCNLIADIYRSTPALVGRPSSLIPDETYRRFASDATVYSYSAKSTDDPAKHRPLTLYTSTNDGMLHAFRVFPPAGYDPATDPLVALDATHTEVNELWAFIPPAMLPHLIDLYPSNRQLLLDGEPVVRDVVATGTYDESLDEYPWILERTGNDAELGNSTWRTVLVQGFGDSLAGGGYYALDVTDPEKGPRFLWQLTVDAAGDPLFGKAVAAPLITTVFTSAGTTEPREVAVAILPGGVSAASAAPAGSCLLPSPAPVTVDSTYPLRPSVRCYPPVPAVGEPARSVTIVRLDTGAVLATFRNTNEKLPVLSPGLVRNTGLVAPMTGRPAAFPGGTGSIADRVYIGDAEGILWRINLSSPDPARWTMRPFFDAYNTHATVDGEWDSGQAIVTAPIVSTDDAGTIVLNFSTGQQDFDADAPDGSGDLAGMKTYVWSLREQEGVGASSVGSRAQWFIELEERERVTGPMQLFDGQLYFSSYWPVSGSGVCTVGESKVWGVDFLAPANPSNLKEGGLAKLVIGGATEQCITSATSGDANGTTYGCAPATTLFPEGSSIFGATVTQLPSCADSGDPTTDPFMGGTNQHTTVGRVRPGRYQLLMQTGNQGTAISGGVTNAVTINLTTPPSMPIVESWAAIVE